MTKDQLYDKALSLFGENLLDDAINAFQELIEKFPNEIEGYMGLAHAYERAQNYDGAIDAVKLSNAAWEMQPEQCKSRNTQ